MTNTIMTRLLAYQRKLNTSPGSAFPRLCIAFCLILWLALNASAQNPKLRLDTNDYFDSTFWTTANANAALTGINGQGSLTLHPSRGGTGLSSYTAGDLLFASGTTAFSKLGAASTGNALISGTSPSWGKIGLGTHVSGVLPVANGGTGLSSLGSALQIVRVNAGGTALEYAAGGGDVVGPASATSNAIVRFNGTTGKLVKNSGASVDDAGNVVATIFQSGTNTLGAGGLSLVAGDLLLGSTEALYAGGFKIASGVVVGGSHRITSSASVARELGLPDSDGNVVLDAAVQTLSGKTLDGVSLAAAGGLALAINAADVTTSNKTFRVVNATGALPLIVAHTSNAVTVANTTTETDLFSQTLPRKGLTRAVGGSPGSALVRLGGTYLNNSGANRTVQLAVKLGATTMWRDTSAVLAASTGNRRWTMEFTIQNTADNAQKMGGFFSYSSALLPTTGTGPLSTESLRYLIGGTAAEDTGAADKTIAVSCIHSVAATTVTMTCDYATVEILP